MPVIMNDTVVSLLFASLWSLLAYAVYMRLVVVRNLQRKLVAGTAEATHEARQKGAEEVGALKKRIAVLERIAVEKENALAGEIEALRAR